MYSQTIRLSTAVGRLFGMDVIVWLGKVPSADGVVRGRRSGDDTL